MIHGIFGVAESIQALRELRRPAGRILRLGWLCAAVLLLAFLAALCLYRGRQ